ncbi:putative ankyrin repeat protein [Powai lake megavirus]|uniref:Putative ankyrin repeat protein n=1 Tax=Powai lake megavirus TaxID=1842663 RepID=A0A167RDX1_9VIRU|nr:putative ankyrin repeat protein [Powai lake megavirus]ANB50573.1 putative ankyrin repeat protein [Powai lake megavirus]
MTIQMEDYDFDKEYYCSKNVQCSGFSKLMHLIFVETNETIITDYLTNHMDEIHVRNKLQWTPLMIACINNKKCNNFNIIKLLIKYGSDVNAQNNNGTTPLMMASYYTNHYDKNIVQLLLENKADPNIQRNDRLTALIFVSYTNNLNLIKLLLQNGANPNLRTNNGNTILTILLEHNNNDNDDNILETIDLLLNNGANPNIKNNFGNTALTLVNHNQYIVEILDILLKYISCSYSKDSEKIFFADSSILKYSERCRNITEYYIYRNISFKNVMRELKIVQPKFIFRPTSIRIRIMILKWNLDNNILSQVIKLSNFELIDYLGTNDFDDLKLKVDFITKNLN